MACVLSGFALAGRYRGTVPHWIVFGVDSAVLIAFAIFMMTFRLKRLI